jgi:hypothetical protein
MRIRIKVLFLCVQRQTCPPRGLQYFVNQKTDSQHCPRETGCSIAYDHLSIFGTLIKASRRISLVNRLAVPKVVSLPVGKYGRGIFIFLHSLAYKIGGTGLEAGTTFF